MSDKKSPVVGILMGSASDKEKMRGAVDALKRFGVEYEVAVLSAHRVPDKVSSFVRGARERGLKVLIAGAGWAAHLAGAVAANTTLPVIGVPLSGSPLGGEDALLATVMMPKGIPVATVGVDKLLQCRPYRGPNAVDRGFRTCRGAGCASQGTGGSHRAGERGNRSLMLRGLVRDGLSR